MAFCKVPIALVKKMKAPRQGINPALQKIEKEFMVHVEFDGKEQVTLSSDNNDILDLALDTLERDYGGAPSPDNGYNCLLGNTTVVWTFYGDTGATVDRLFTKELQELKKNKSVKVSSNPSSKQKYCLTISCNQDSFPEVKRKVDSFSKSIIHPARITVASKDTSKVAQFVKDADKEGFVCEFSDGKYLKIHGRTEEDINLGKESWKRRLAEPNQKNVTKINVKPSETENGKAGNKPKGKLAASAQQKVTDKMKQKTASAGVSDSGATNDDEKTDLDNETEWDDTTRTKPQMTTPTSDSPVESAGEAEFRGEIGSTSGSGRDAKYECDIGKLKVKIYNESITTVKGVDAIVNAANDRMMHGGGVAYYISKAAGKEMDDECNRYISKNGNLEVSKNFVSKAGKLQYRGIIHAVGPMWSDYRDQQDRCAEVLYDTVFNVLQETANRKWRGVALSAISSGIYGVPKRLCAEMYVKAFVDFAKEDVGSVRDVHFVDINRDILDMVVDAHKSWCSNPDALNFKNALDYASAPSFAGKKTSRPTKSSVVKFVEARDFKDGSSKVQYMINDTLNVFIYTMSVTDLKDVEAIVCTVKPDLQGGRLAEAIAQAGGSKYAKELEKMRANNAPLRDGHVLLCKEVGKLRVKAVLHLVAEVTVQDSSQRSMEYLSFLNRSVLGGATYHKIKKLAMSLIGAGYHIKAQRDIATLCSGLASDIIDFCLDSKEKRTLTELHLVNLDPGMTQTLLTEFRNRSQGIEPPPRSEFDQTGAYGGGEGRRDRYYGGGGGGGYRQYREESDGWYIPTQADGWIEHKPLPEVSSKMSSVVQKNSMKGATSSRDLSKSTKLECSVCDNAPKEQLPCGHSFCNVCSVPLKSNKACYFCKAESNKAHSKSVSKGASKSVAASGDKECPICIEPLLNTHVLPCEHELCKTCLGNLVEPKCPFCGSIFGILTGTQPNGQMFYRYRKYYLLGYEKDGTIEIVFQFKDGKQGDKHPNPGKPYKGTHRIGYLPDNEEGKKVLSLMRRAFDRRLMFTIGDSVTTGKGDRVTYNDIHLKTTPEKGKYGYPDPMYLRRVQEELASKGITE